MDIEDILSEAYKIRDNLKKKMDFPENPIDATLPCVKPFVGTKEVKLIVIGQDPTIKNENSRSLIRVSLNLDKPNGSLSKYLCTICQLCGISIENVYVTNIFKYFYSRPPASTMQILRSHLSANLGLLQEELNAYPDAAIITLGEPVLQLLTGTDTRVNKFWDYNKLSSISGGNFKYCLSSDNGLNRIFYPYPHQPSSIKRFYKAYLESYSKFLVESHKIF